MFCLLFRLVFEGPMRSLSLTAFWNRANTVSLGLHTNRPHPIPAVGLWPPWVGKVLQSSQGGGAVDNTRRQ